jgi:hypothetical protein
MAVASACGKGLTRLPALLPIIIVRPRRVAKDGRVKIKG